MGSRKRVWAFRAIAVSLPLVVLAVVEGLLRLFGYGHDTSLFIRYPDDARYWVMNEYASERYFTNAGNETKGFIEPFAVEKAPGTVRIFVLGESTTAGYPYFHNGSFHRWLQYRLMREHPEVHYEIVNLSLTAVNSYTVLDFGKQLVDYQPDAVLVYTGHNEYYGALGVGSTSRFGGWRWMVRAMIQLRRLRVVQWVGGFWGSFRHENADERENLMQRMAKDQSIAFGSAKFEAGVKQFEENMTELCKTFKKHGVPVYLSTVVSNLRDQRPFVGGDSVYARAEGEYKAGDLAGAKRDFVQAKEADGLRFRAPEAINGIIVKLAAEFSNVRLVRADSVFAVHSPGGIVGKELLLEHVHPNLYGYALLSEAYYRAMGGKGAMPLDSLWREMPVTAMDSLNGAYTIMMLKSRWPWNEAIADSFRRGGSIAEQLAGGVAVGRISWSDGMNELYTLSMRQQDKKTALKAVGALLLEHPTKTVYALYAGRLSYELGDTSGALYYFKYAVRTDPSPVNKQSLYLLYTKLGRPPDARYFK
jgi:lysophospholipase L1-like esterase